MGLNRRRKEPLPDIVCFHCQQCIEKYLKAYLVSQGIAPPRTHDLDALLAECVTHDATLGRHLTLVKSLDPYSVRFRYPGTSATVAEAKDAVQTARGLRLALRRKLGL
jgi:HEPN domain-containing protein